MSPDPFGYGDGLNFFAYVGNDPVNFVDPSGLGAVELFDYAKENPAEFALTTAIVVGGVALDVITVPSGESAAIAAFAPATARKILAGSGKNPLTRGQAAEQRVLKDLELAKNTKKVRTNEGASIPDGLTKRESIEIKDCILVSCTKQVRIQTGAARRAERDSVLITGTKTHVSGPAKRAFDRIIRRYDLGRQ